MAAMSVPSPSKASPRNDRKNAGTQETVLSDPCSAASELHHSLESGIFTSSL
jgi:hypothetical protein